MNGCLLAIIAFLLAGIAIGWATIGEIALWIGVGLLVLAPIGLAAAAIYGAWASLSEPFGLRARLNRLKARAEDQFRRLSFDVQGLWREGDGSFRELTKYEFVRAVEWWRDIRVDPGKRAAWQNTLDGKQADRWTNDKGEFSEDAGKLILRALGDPSARGQCGA